MTPAGRRARCPRTIPAVTATGWQATERRTADLVTPGAAARLAATLDVADAPSSGDPLPPLWHWLYFLPDDPQATLAADGHPRRGGFLPPVPLGRRMHAGGRLEFHAPLRVGDEATRVSVVTSVDEKQGRTGPLVVVTVRHRITGPAGLAVTEEQDLVYTDARPPRDAGDQAAIAEGTWESTVVPDEALLFRFSALTFNTHRIHYDLGYATAVEGYPDLVVHGPLVALLLAVLARSRGVAVAGFTFRAHAPFFCGRPIHLRGDPGGRLAAYDPSGRLGMEASFR